MEHLGLSVRVLLALVCFLTAPAAADFEPIPKELQELYHFQLEKNFYENEASFEADLEMLEAKIEDLEDLKGQVIASAENLLRAHELNSELIPLWGKLWVYAYLRYAINTTDMALFNKIQTYKGFIAAISGIHSTNRANHICWCCFYIERNFRSITSAWANFKKVIYYFFSYATSSK